jgi:Asp-tRNA(Asn)/Glu-tRNA(Gln) amidotransferase A subunit family amidase
MSIALLPATEIASLIRRRDVSAAEAVEEILERIALLNGTLNAYCLVLAEPARRAARVLDERLERAEEVGPLAGVPVAVKDVLWQRGVPSCDGSRAHADFVPEESTAPVERLEAAGAIPIGRTNVPEFCYRGVSVNDLYGATGNPWDPGRTPGGSSGGSAAAVAAGLAPLALGSDGGGSIRIPASFCGIPGLKPTFGLVPRAPEWPGWQTLTHVGPLAFTVADCALMLQVLAGPDPRDPRSLPALGKDYVAAAADERDLSGLRVTVSADLGYVRLDNGVRDAFRAAVERFRGLGAVVEEAHPGLGNPVDTWNTIACVDNAASEGSLLESGLVGDDARGLIEPGTSVSAADYARARNAMSDYAAVWARFMTRYDLLLTPAMELTAFPLGRFTPAVIGGEPVSDVFDDWCHFCYPFNLTGQPAMSVPMGAAENGLPVGLQIVGRRFEDDLVLRAAAAWERIAPWPRPPLAAPPPARVPPDIDEIVAAARAGSRRIELRREATALRAGECLALGDGRTAEVTRVYSPRSGQVVVELAAA